MKTTTNCLFILFLFLFTQVVKSQSIIVDHNCAKLDPIPAIAIENAKSTLHVAYGHTSHGSQLIEGMSKLVGQTSLIGYKGDIYNWHDGPQTGALDIDDYFVAGDLGHNGDLAWETATRAYLAQAQYSDVNVVMWSWCGGVSDNTEAGINTYLNAMNQLEQDFPNIKFVYMTGHLDGTGETGNLHVRNEQIRDYCKQNNKILYDFADIESYNPDGNYFLNKAADDNCDYVDNGSPYNWATQWQTSHTQDIYWYACSPQHTQALNGNLKAYAAWWLFAKIAGWDEKMLVLTSSEQLTESNLDDAAVHLRIVDDSFLDHTLSITNFQLQNAPAGCSINSITYVNDTACNVQLSFDGTDFDNDINNFRIQISASELVGNQNLQSNAITIEAVVEPEPAVQISVSESLTEQNLNGAIVQIELLNEQFIDNTLSSGNFDLLNEPTGCDISAITYQSATSCTITLSFDGTDFDTDISNFKVQITANELVHGQTLQSNSLTIDAIDESAPYATLSASEDLVESELDGAVIHITLSNESFNSTNNTAAFMLQNAPAGLTVASYTSTGNEADITLSFDGTDFDEDSVNFCVLIKKAILAGNDDLVTNSIIITAENEQSFSEIENDRKTILYPNPSNGNFTLKIETQLSKNAKLRIIDQNGKTVLNQLFPILSDDKQDFNLNGLKPGNYWVLISDGRMQIVNALVIE